MSPKTARAKRRFRADYPTVTVLVLAAAVIIIPNGYMGGAVDTFRLPKEMLFRGAGILLLAIGAFAATARRARWRETLATISRVEWIVICAVAGWTAVTTLTSTNRFLSEQSLITTLAGVSIYIATRLVAPRLTMDALAVVLAAACGNAIVVILQELHIWNPFVFPVEVEGHMHSVGLLGNPNDVGTFLVAPALAAAAAAVVVPGWRRLMYLGFTALLFAGIVASQTRTAMIAYVAAIIVAALLRPWRQGVTVAVVLVIAAVIALRPSTPFGRHFLELVHAARTRDYPLLFSERVVPFLSAIEMVREHPASGVGPGCYKYEFMDTRLKLEHRYRPEWTRGWPMNFAETHNDHLQVAAETGLPGYAILLSALFVLAWPSRRRAAIADGAVAVPPQPVRRSFAHAFRAPLAAAFFVAALAQFPLQLAAPRLAFITLAALAVGWDRADD
jgi:O-antigen ligase